MNENPFTVSVIIPTYNRAHLVGRAIKSVLNQTFQDFEIIVVDDGSTDSTKEVVTSFNDTRIRYIKHQMNKGGNAARNTGLKNSKGEYIAFLDSDDEWLPEKLERQLEVFEKSEDERLGAVYCGIILFSENMNKEIKKVLPEKRGCIFENLLIGLTTVVPTAGSCGLIKKEVFNKCGFFDECEELKKGGHQEYEMWIRIAKKYNFDFAKKCLLKYHIRSGNSVSTTVALQDAVRANEYIVDKFIEDYKKVPKILSNRLRYIGGHYCLGGDVKRGGKLFLRSIRYNFLNIKSYICWLISLFGAGVYNKINNFKIIIFNKKRNKF